MKEFNQELLPITKDFPNDPIILSLNREVMFFIGLTENETVKMLLTESNDIFRDLYRCLHYAHSLTRKKPNMTGYRKAAHEALGV